MACSSPIKVLVCGGRDFLDKQFVFKSLDAVHAEIPIAVLVHGNARGADTIGKEWAEAHPEIIIKCYPADWAKHGKAAGFIRNAQMLTESPDLVVAFPGGNGTKHM